MEQEELAVAEFFDAIYRDTEGYVYLARKPASKVEQNSWIQDWYSWPSDREKLAKKVVTASGRYEVYFGPTLYRTKNVSKSTILGSWVSWVDFDGNAPKDSTELPEPSIRVQSSLPSHQHWYWRLNDFVTDIEELERLNRNLTYQLGSDLSGWDAVQVLRPPGTTNHKRSHATLLLEAGEIGYDLASFIFKQEAPEPVDPIEADDIPDCQFVLDKYQFKGKLFVLFKNGDPENDRSTSLMKLAYSFAEVGLSNAEILSLIKDADNRWGKFHKRHDCTQQLLNIVSVARAKYPDSEKDTDTLPVGRLQAYGFKTLLFHPEIELEWVWDGLLQEAGYMLLTSPSGVGKTQLSLDFAIQAVLGKDFLDREIKKDMKLAFMSLEMGPADLKFFQAQMSKGLSAEEIDYLEEHLILLPVGEPYYLNKERERDDLEAFIADNEIDGIILDSLSSMVEGELTSEGNVKPVMDWNDKIRKRHNIFTWIIHHHRKASGDNKKPNKLDDVYGSYLVPRNATTTLTLWQGMGDSILAIPNKVRMSKKTEPLQIFRDGNLHFTTKKSGITIVKKGKDKEVVEVEVEDDGEFSSKFSY